MRRASSSLSLRSLNLSALPRMPPGRSSLIQSQTAHSPRKLKEQADLEESVESAEIDTATIQIELGKYDEAVETLKRVVQQAGKDSKTRALVFISMAKALSNRGKSADTKRCLKLSCGILEKREEDSPSKVAEAYTGIAALYESLNELKVTISLLKVSLSMLERLPQDQHMKGNVSAKVGWLLLLTSKVEQAIGYLESAAERMKESFSPKHFLVRYIYNNLGDAYMELERPQSTAKMLFLQRMWWVLRWGHTM